MTASTSKGEDVAGRMDDPNGLLTQYDHLNAGGIPLQIDMDDLAKQIVSQNYGFIRMISALCRHQRAKFKDGSRFAEKIELLILQGERS